MASTDLDLHALGRGLGRGRRGVASLGVCGDMAPPTRTVPYIPAHRLTSSWMVMEKSVKRKENYSALIPHRFAMRRTTDMHMRFTSHVIVVVMRRGGRLTRFKYLKLYYIGCFTWNCPPRGIAAVLVHNKCK